MMLNIDVVAVGKIHEKYIDRGIEEYVRCLKTYCQLNIVEVPDLKVPESLSEAEKEEIKDKEGQTILRHIKKDIYVIALAIEGQAMTSQQLAAHIYHLTDMGYNDLCFIIGGTLGLSKDVIKRADMLLSFSNMTFPHQLVRLILLSQLCRCFHIISKQVYK